MTSIAKNLVWTQFQTAQSGIDLETFGDYKKKSKISANQYDKLLAIVGIGAALLNIILWVTGLVCSLTGLENKLLKLYCHIGWQYIWSWEPDQVTTLGFFKLLLK